MIFVGHFFEGGKNLSGPFRCFLLTHKDVGLLWVKQLRLKGQNEEIARFQEKTRDFWSCYPDLNRGPHPYQGCALPAEL